MVPSFYYVLIPVALIIVLLRKCRECTWGKCQCDISLQERVFLVTGANSGIGKEVTRELCKRKAKVIMACRNMDNAKIAINDIRKSTTLGEMIPMELDLASLDSIKEFAKRVVEEFPEIHVLVNNAGVYVPLKDHQPLTKDGFEIHFGTNHLGHFLLTNLLVDKLKKSAPSRIVIVTSKLLESGAIDFTNLNSEKTLVSKGRMNPGYCNSKLANAFFGIELARRLQNTGVNVYSVCPGFTYTGLFKHVKRQWFHYIVFSPVALLFLRTANQGAQTVLKCAIDHTLANESGKLYRDCKIYTPTKKTLDFETASKLWEVSAKMIGLEKSSI